MKEFEDVRKHFGVQGVLDHIEQVTVTPITEDGLDKWIVSIRKGKDEVSLTLHTKDPAKHVNVELFIQPGVYPGKKTLPYLSFISITGRGQDRIESSYGTEFSPVPHEHFERLAPQLRGIVHDLISKKIFLSEDSQRDVRAHVMSMIQQVRAAYFPDLKKTDGGSEI